MSITLKQILTRIEELAASHRQINYFFVGGADEFLDQEDVTYPALFCEVQSDANVSVTNRVCQYNFKLYFLDLLDVADRSLNNQWDVKSDMSQIASDMVSLIYDQTYTGWEVNEDYSINVVEWELQDLTAGVVVDISIGSRFDANRCQVPTDADFSNDVFQSYTLKEFIQRIEKLALSHKQINHFFIGAPDQFLDQEDVIYPALFCELNQDSNVSLTNRIASFSFTFYFFDLLDIADRSLNNEWEVKSDMASVMLDFIALLKNQSFQYWEISDEYNVRISDYELQDLTCGVSFTCNIGFKFDANRCQIPSTYIWDQYVDSNLTLKQTIERIKGLTLSHKQINHFFIGRFDEFLDGEDVIYPACFAELNEPGRISVQDRLIHYTFTFYFFDLMDIADRSLNNEFEVKSDMASVAMDFLSMLNYPGFQHSWEIGPEYQMGIRDYQLQDLTCGVSVKVDISTRFDANKCQVPVEIENFLLWNDNDYFMINSKDKLILS